MIWIILLQGCSSASAPIVSLDQPPSELIKTHRVEQGETMYSIAWRYDYSVANLAKANGLSDSSVLQEGQILNLDLSKVKKQQSSKRSIGTADSKKAAKTSANTDSKTQANVWLKKVKARDLKWREPLKGKIVESFNPKKLRKGIVFQSAEGSSVRPVAKGVVVYAGDGLRDYGKLVIIKHSDYLLSAYGHNRKLLVREGQLVDSGQIISKLGSSGRLYFEIRKDGKPVNPLLYLN
jgi:lipoprotein NlpD